MKKSRFVSKFDDFMTNEDWRSDFGTKPEKAQKE
jgi:hypothetical protein